MKVKTEKNIRKYDLSSEGFMRNKMKAEKTNVKSLFYDITHIKRESIMSLFQINKLSSLLVLIRLEDIRMIFKYYEDKLVKMFGNSFNSNM